MISEPLTWSVHDVPSPSDAFIVDAGLEASNLAAAPLFDVQPLACFAYSPSGSVVAGALGRTWGACCELQQLWVEPALRRNGIASRLVRLFEERATARGCRIYYLETFSFQSPAFYRILGYEPSLELRGFPCGIVKYVMTKTIGAAVA